ncbi:hypothetical protein GJ496_007889 [Pomphorhynchus laevis]|nr:hypothetical protein GJ496_007889 [Pomphorhynchus laevis]
MKTRRQSVVSTEHEILSTPINQLPSEQSKIQHGMTLRSRKSQVDYNENNIKDDVSCYELPTKAARVSRSPSLFTISSDTSQEQEIEPFYHSSGNDADDSDSSYSCHSTVLGNDHYGLISGAKRRKKPQSPSTHSRKFKSLVKRKLQVIDIFDQYNDPDFTVFDENPFSKAIVKLTRDIFTLPCRETECAEIEHFVKSRIGKCLGGCMYLYGLPGTGKTATVKRAILNILEVSKENYPEPPFRFRYINIMKLKTPTLLYSHLWEVISGKYLNGQAALQNLSEYFSSGRKTDKTNVIVIDELDLIWSCRETIFYNIFDWPSSLYSNLIVITIANTMIVPKKLMQDKITSRMGFFKRCFYPYTSKELEKIVNERYKDDRVFSDDSLLFASKRVASKNGDFRKMVDLLRTAIQICERRGGKFPVTIVDMGNAATELFRNPTALVLKDCTKHAKLFLFCLCDQLRYGGTDEIVFRDVQDRHHQTCRLYGISSVSTARLWEIVRSLRDCGLLVTLSKCDNPINLKLKLGTSIEQIESNIKADEFICVKATLMGGQSFRWTKLNKTESLANYILFQGVIQDVVYQIFRISPQSVGFSVHSKHKTSKRKAAKVLINYLNKHISLSDLYKQWCDYDRHFETMTTNRTRVLKIEPLECVISFICSSNNTVKRISQMVDRLCKQFGTYIGEVNDKEEYVFPTIDAMCSENTEDILKHLGFGYRAKFIAQTVQKLQNLGGKAWLNGLRNLDYTNAKSELMKLPGIGTKVADCILLMSFDHHNVVPVDVHIKNIAINTYKLTLPASKSLTDCGYTMISKYLMEQWGSFAGWAQANIFTTALSRKRELSSSNKSVNLLKIPLKKHQASRKRKQELKLQNG